MHTLGGGLQDMESLPPPTNHIPSDEEIKYIRLDIVSRSLSWTSASASYPRNAMKSRLISTLKRP
ncbi:hypothetical protein B0H12DRAFT_1140206 [Mycena haematopus]|nr:hypothetical protein B0H12DRAFT_1140206 [Mycena haematopus]